ncbi:hypothetical protein J6590_050432 [Homalodisca vitripennis]|nr:hypothetical protein J6590_050432 [Homalodisca vitripennis]
MIALASEAGHLLVLEKMKNDEAGGMGCFLVAVLNSESLLGLADTPSSRVSKSTEHISSNEL